MVAPNGFVALENSSRQPMSGAAPVGAADPNETVSVSILVRRRPDAPPFPDTAALASTPVAGRKCLSREEFADTYGALPADLAAVEDFARDHGLSIVESSIPRRTVVVSGTVRQMNQAFGVELQQHQSPTHRYRSFSGQVHVPAARADLIEGVFGLDNRQIARPAIVRADTTAAATAPLTPPEVAKLYNFPAQSAAGQTIGIIEFGGGYKPADIQAFFNGLHLPVPTLTDVSVDGATNSPDNTTATVENLLDIDVAGSVAIGAKIVMYFAPGNEQGFLDVITKSIHDATNKPSVLSISWVWGEPAWITSLSTIFQEAFALGVTVFAASGDNGSGAAPNAGVNYPASDPWVTGCGGTSVENVVGASFYQPVWPGSGGGISSVFGLPSWQSWAHVPPSVNPGGHVGRGVPDVAGNADPSSGYMLIENGTSTGPWGGTSAVAPLYAGLVALLNANLGEPVGYLNYNLYAFSGPYVYDDVTVGSNGAYNAGAGWDACTGFGSINGTQLLTALRGVGLPPALAEFNGKLFMAWKGMEFDDRIFWSTFNGTSWAPQKLVPNVGTSSGVALAVFQGKLYMAWKGLQDDQRIFWSAFNGASWSAQQVIPGVATSTGPRLAVYNNLLYAAWKGESGDQGIWWSTFNGTSWAPQREISGVATSVGPALAVFQNALYAAWKGEFGDQGIWWSKFNGTSWTPQHEIPGVASSEGPSLAVFRGALYAAWKGELGDQRIWWSSFNGANWLPQKQLAGVASSVGPGLAIFNNALYAAWKGSLGDQRIWWSRFNGASWAPQQVVPGVGTSPDVALQRQSFVEASLGHADADSSLSQTDAESAHSQTDGNGKTLVSQY